MLKKYNKEQVGELLTLLDKRASDISPEIIKTVTDVITDVRKNGDEALRRYTKNFDKVELGESMYLDPAETEKAGEKLSRLFQCAFFRRCLRDGYSPSGRRSGRISYFCSFRSSWFRFLSAF